MLITNRTSFIVPGKQAYLPFMGALLTERGMVSMSSTGRQTFSPAAQVLLLTHLQKESFEGKIFSEIAKHFPYSVKTVAAAAKELGKEGVTIEYVYGNQFFGDADITSYMDTWYQTTGVEVVFACGGGIWTSAAEAAAKVGGKVIGVDVDQSKTIDAYGAGMTVTSAMKGLKATVNTLLTELILNDNWSAYGGQVMTLGLVSGTDVEANYTQIPFDTTQWADGFTQDDYVALVGRMFSGEISVDGSQDEFVPSTIILNRYDNIK